MEVKLSEIVNAYPKLAEIANKEMPIAESYHFARALSALKAEFDHYETKRHELIRKYGDEDDSGLIRVKPNTDQHNKFIEEINDLLEVEVDVKFDPINVKNINADLQPSVLMGLDKFVTYK